MFDSRCTDTRDSLDLHNYSDDRVIEGTSLCDTIQHRGTGRGTRPSPSPAFIDRRIEALSLCRTVVEQVSRITGIEQVWILSGVAPVTPIRVARHRRRRVFDAEAVPRFHRIRSSRLSSVSRATGEPAQRVCYTYATNLPVQSR